MTEVRKTVIVLGPKNCGKSSLLARLTEEGTKPMMRKSSGFHSRWFGKNITIGDTEVILQFLEVDSLIYQIDMYLQTADAAVIVFDSREVDSQMKSINLMRRVRKMRASLPIALVTSKCDDGPVCKGPTHSFFPHISTSVSTGLGLGELEKAVTRLSFPDLVKRQDRWDRITSTLQRTLSGIKSHSSDALQNLQRCIASRPTVTRSLSSNAARGRTPFNKPAFRFNRISFS